MSSPQLLNRRQSLSLAAWAVLGAGCEARTSDPAAASATAGASPRPGATSAAAAAPPAAATPPEFTGLSDPVALQFYQQRAWRPAWNSAQSESLTRSLGEARRHGLERVSFAPKATPGAAGVQQDIGLTLTALRYAQALASGYVDPKTIEKVFTLERNEIDLAAGLEQALAGGKVADWLASLPPSDDEYKALSSAYALGSACQAAPAAKPDPAPAAEPTPPAAAPAPPPAGQGATPQTAAPAPPPSGAPPSGGSTPEAAPPGAAPAPSPTVPAAPPAETAPGAGAPGSSLQNPTAETQDNEQATKRAAIPTAERARQLAANLERRRWLARTPPATRVDVNTAACFLVYLKPDTAPWTARVVDGKPHHETPSIQGVFHRLIANPPWRVPMDIARREIFPKGGGYMRREHMRVVDGMVVQHPGPHSSLGLVKFDVQDPYEIYLHDTPSKSLFGLPERHKSHGCVRVQNAIGFARLIAGQNGKLDAFNKALASGKTSEVDIGEPITVRLLYHTAYATEDGQVTIVPDAYGWNDKLAQALGFSHAPSGARGEQPDVDLGP